MSRMYNSLKEALQETLHRGNTDPTRIDSVEGNHTAGLTDEIDELESIVVDRIGRLKTAAKEGEAVVAGQTRMPSRSLRISTQVLLPWRRGSMKRRASSREISLTIKKWKKALPARSKTCTMR